MSVEKFRRAGVTLLGKSNGPKPDPEAGQSVKFQAPFTFAPLSPVCESPWGKNLPSMGRPHKDGVCGELALRWTFDRPVLVGGAASNGSFVTIDGEKALPGATTRGLIRNVLEIATSSRMRLTDRSAHHAVRDMEDEIGHWASRNPVDPNYPQNGVRRSAFWLTHPMAGQNIDLERVYEGWRLTEGREVQIETAKLYAFWKLTSAEQRDFETKNVRAKYDWLARRSSLRAVLKFDVGADGKAVPSANGKHEGWLFLTGADPKRAKKHETVFFTPRAAGGFAAPAGMMRRLFRIYGTAYRNESEQSTGALGVWLDALAEGRLPGLGANVRIDAMPAFMVTYENEVERVNEATLAEAAAHNAFLAMSRMVKVPHKRSIGAVLDRNGHKTDGDFLDFVEAFFGFVPDEIGEGAEEKPTAIARKGRVAFGMGRLAAGGADESGTTTGVTMSPRTSYWPFYAAPKPPSRAGGNTTRPADWSSDDVTVAGWKRYPVRKSQGAFGQGEGGVVSEMRFTRAGTAFEQRVRLHNALPEEVGGLLWALTLGAPDGLDGGAHGLRHAIGRGKAQGFGSASCRIGGLDGLERNDGGTVQAAADFVAAFKAYALTKAQAAARAQRGVAIPESFETIPAVATLLATANPEIGEAVKERLAYPDEPPRAAGAGAEGETRSLAGYRKIRKAA